MTAGPRAHADPAFLAARLARLEEPHVAGLNALAEQIERTTRRPAPRVDPDSGGTGARVLLLLETPSVAGTYGSGLISLDNDDATAANLLRAVEASGLARTDLVVWNAVPWFVGTAERGVAPSAGELRLGQTWLVPFLTLLPRLEVVVALGRSAQAAVTHLSTATPALGGRRFTVLLAPHPSQRVYNRPGYEGRERVHAALAEAAGVLRPPGGQGR
ncbi:uracil-DNA glycosylase [Microlunatus flavus]|uniref:Uracil DNA glycosylase superfamily protein n=1 Tax=Microlunatus flavus TaxID=1036181 RepID=A0A1H8ZZM8_9ACTN|nr:uracil-DNA glycosylase [Microlunatus flavus]SEP69854.1 Uracil DNA glycosylase superfamily protein [Microlunatus flavus]